MEDRLGAATKEFKTKKNLVRIRKSDMEKESPVRDENGDQTPLGEEIQALGHETVEDYEAALEDAQNKVNSIHDDPNAIKQYEDNLAEIERVQEQLEQVQGNKDSLDRQIEKVLSPWKATLHNAIEEINNLFTGYMAELGVTGEVRLKKGGENGNEDSDFKNWGIEIRVSFREGVKAQVLSAQVQ